jgi:hypothetical protein
MLPMPQLMHTNDIGDDADAVHVAGQPAAMVLMAPLLWVFNVLPDMTDSWLAWQWVKPLLFMLALRLFVVGVRDDVSSSPDQRQQRAERTPLLLPRSDGCYLTAALSPVATPLPVLLVTLLLVVLIALLRKPVL